MNAESVTCRQKRHYLNILRNRGFYKTRRHGSLLVAFVPDWLMTEIRNVRWLSDDRPFFHGEVSPRSVERSAQRLREIFETLGKTCGIVNLTPHRLRHTFAVRKLEDGVPLPTVSRMLGHTNDATTEGWYAQWTDARLLRLYESSAPNGTTAKNPFSHGLWNPDDTVGPTRTTGSGA